MKYIIFKQLNEEFPVLFPSTIKHSDMNKAVKQACFNPQAVSAGFVMPDYDNDCVRCFGDSMTLNLPARSQDTQIVNKYLGL